MKQIDKDIFAIHGGGNIGLGLMADIVSQSDKPYKIIATSSNQFTNEIINSCEEFWLHHQNKEEEQNFSHIKNIKMLYSRQKQNIIKLYKNAQMGAICLTEDALKKSAPLIAEGLISRYQSNKDNLKILVLMNKQNCDSFVKNEVTKAMKSQIKNTEVREEILTKVQFIPTVADRIVSKVPDDEIMDQLKDQLKNSKIGSITKKELAQLKEQDHFKFYLFHAEKYFSLYVPNYLREAHDFPGTTKVNNLNRFMTIKNKYINGPHAILAWLGGLMGYTTIAKAIKNPFLLAFIEKMMQFEIAPILMAEFKELSEKYFLTLKNSFIKRCEQNTVDSIIRVGKDPLRKLNSNGCVRGILDLKQKNNLSLATPRLEKGIAAGIMYAMEMIDPNNEECQKITEIYRKDASFQSILCYKGEYGNGKYAGLHPEKDKEVIANILQYLKQDKVF